VADARINKMELLLRLMLITSFGLDERGFRGSTSGRNTTFLSTLKHPGRLPVPPRLVGYRGYFREGNPARE
jgi:hypothetical protein